MIRQNVASGHHARQQKGPPFLATLFGLLGWDIDQL